MAVPPEAVRLLRLQSQLEIFRQTFGHRAMQPLTAMLAWDRQWPPREAQQRAPAGFPHALSGLYALSDDAGELRYIGLTTADYGQRLSSLTRTVVYRFVDVVPLDADWRPLGLALQGWLIQALRPPDNSGTRSAIHAPMPKSPKSPSG